MANHRFQIKPLDALSLMEHLDVPIALDILGDDEIVELYAREVYRGACGAQEDLQWFARDELTHYSQLAKQMRPAELRRVCELLEIDAEVVLAA